jgi:hypothetical protein
MAPMKKPLETLTSRTPPQFCPVCFEFLDTVTSITAAVLPQPDDFTVCIGCGSVLKFDANMMLLPSSLMEIPTHSRMEFAEVVTEVKNRGRFKT